MAFQNQQEFTNIFQLALSSANTELLVGLPTHLCNNCACDFHLADEAFHTGRLEATSRGWKKYWDQWQAYTAPMGVDPYLQNTQFSKQIRLLSGFAAQVRTGFYGQQKQVKNCTVSTALTAVGQTIPLACNSNPTKVTGSERFLPRLQIMLDGYRKVDPPTKKMLPVQADIPELLIKMAYKFGSSECDKATTNLTMIAFYYLLCIGKYMVKGTQNNSKQMVQFKYKDVTFFRKNNLGQLQCLPRDAPDKLISTADGATLKLDN
jgi:hypothetical protein